MKLIHEATNMRADSAGLRTEAFSIMHYPSDNAALGSADSASDFGE